MNIKEKILAKSERLGRAVFHYVERRKQKDKRRVNIAKSVKLSSAQKRAIDNFYKENLGKKVKYNWHKLYTAISGKFDYKYLPEYLYTADFTILSNNPRYYKALQDKTILPLIVKGSELNVRVPKILFSSSNKLILNENKETITKDELLKKLINLDSFFIKPSIDSNSGKDCFLYKKEFGYCEEDLKRIVDSYNGNFLVQEVVENQSDIKKLNPSSLNTFRVTTYLLDGFIYVAPLVLRIGRENKACDNAHAGGLFVAVSNDGEIISDGKTEFNENYEFHPDSKIKLKGYKINNVEKVIKAAKEVASLIPQVGVIDWDFVLDENGNPTLIEGNMFNGGCWLIQMSHGKSLFEENTGRVLQLIRKNTHLYE